jgi:hypothetical protein
MWNVPKDYRYRWLSSASYEDGGPSSGSPIHFTSSPVDLDSAARPALITEGALKAEAAAQIFKASAIIATAGTTAAHHELIEASAAITRSAFPVTIAFDSDHLLVETADQLRTSQNVTRQIARLAVGLLDANLNVRILVWPTKFKGIDDVLIAARTSGAQIPFRSLEPAQWLSILPPALSEYGLTPFKQRSATRAAA